MFSLFFILLSLSFHQILAVEECYVCLENCVDPPQVQKCRHEDLGEDVKMKCYTIEIITGRGGFVEKGCLPADVADAACRRVHNGNEIVCSVCDGNLCNKSSAFVANFTLWIICFGALFYGL